MTETKYRATIVRDNGKEEDWGFYQLAVKDGVVALRTSTETIDGDCDNFIASGTWRDIRDITPED